MRQIDRTIKRGGQTQAIPTARRGDRRDQASYHKGLNLRRPLLDQLILYLEFLVCSPKALSRLIDALTALGIIRHVFKINGTNKLDERDRSDASRKRGQYPTFGALLRLTPAPKFVRVFLRYWGPSRDPLDARGWHIEVKIETQLLLRNALVSRGECSPAPASWPKVEQNVLPADYLLTLTPEHLRELLELQIALVAKLLSTVVGVIENRVREVEIAKTGRSAPCLGDPTATIRKVELARDYPVDSLPGGTDSLFDAAAIALPCLAWYQQAGWRGKSNELRKDALAKLYEKIMAAVMRIEDAFEKQAIGKRATDRRWNLDSPDEIFDLLTRLASRHARHWRRLLATANLQANGFDLDGRDDAQVLARFSKENRPNVRWVLGRALNGGLKTPKDPARARVAHRLRVEFGLLTRERRDRYAINVDQYAELSRRPRGTR